jgi:hypothetical protein
MQYSLLAQILARDPRKDACFPDVPLDHALVALQQLEEIIQELKVMPPPPPVFALRESMPPIIPASLDSSVDAPSEVAIETLTGVPEAPIATSASTSPIPPAPPPEPSVDMDALSSSLASLATQVWRARARIIDPETGEPREEMRRIYRHVESAFEVFDQMGLVIKDWLQQSYDPGLPVKVLTFQPTPDILRDTVLEAVRPTVIWKDRLLQMGEVIVGIPQSAEEKPQ